MNLLNAKTSISSAESAEAALAAVYLNKVGLVVFAYFNALLVAWLLASRSRKDSPKDDGVDVDV